MKQDGNSDFCEGKQHQREGGIQDEPQQCSSPSPVLLEQGEVVQPSLSQGLLCKTRFRPVPAMSLCLLESNLKAAQQKPMAGVPGEFQNCLLNLVTWVCKGCFL